jgi:hypothetical protein
MAALAAATFLVGRPAIGYHVAQKRYYWTIPRCMKTGQRWIAAIIKKLWGTAWSLWEHRNGILHYSEISLGRQ